MAETITVRRGHLAEEFAFVRDLGRRTMLDSVMAFRQASSAMSIALLHASYDRLMSYVAKWQHSLFVASDGERRLGFLLLIDSFLDELTGEAQAFVAYTAVEPSARRRGVGRLMLEAAEAHARAQGMPYLTLMVTEDNIAARALYDSAGFFTERRLLCKIL